jgi:tetratricopeptide (TPR) repeat protein
MKKYLLVAALIALSTGINAQIVAPKASPQGKIEQKIGVTDVKVEYYRPMKNNRVVFGEVVPFNEIWRTGANENTKFTCSDALVFGTDTLRAGTYALFTKPSASNWEIYFYTETSNWGLPETWDASKVALKTTVPTIALNDVVEVFTMNLDPVTSKMGQLSISWDKTRVTVPFAVPTAQKVLASIEKTMAGPSASDYHAAAEFYYKEKKDLQKAREWATKAVEMRGEDAYWMLRVKALIEAELGDYKAAIETAKKSLLAAEKGENKAYVAMNKASIEEWSKKKK